MKRYLLIIISVTSLDAFSQVSTDNVDFTLSCKVGDISILQIQDGISDSFNRFTDGYVAGDNFKIDIKGNVYYFNKEIDGYSLNILSAAKQLPFMLTLSDGELEEKDYSYNYKNSSFIDLQEQTIRLKSIGNTQILMRRYYKNDWQFIFNQVGFNQSYSLTANCMNVNQNFDKFLDAVKKVHGEINKPYGDLD